MTATMWIALGLCTLDLAAAVGFAFYALRWVRAIANVDLAISQEMRLFAHDMISRDPQLEESLQVVLFKLDDWDRKMQRVRLVTFATILREKP